MATVAELLAEGAALQTAEARREAEVLLCAALAKPRSYLIAWSEAPVGEPEARRYRDWLQARSAGTPVAYLTGARDFWSLSLKVSDATLIPRPDTETLVEQALALPLPDDASVLDLGTGSGAIALALASERRRWRVAGSDVSADALAVARSNAGALSLPGLRWFCGHWFDAIPAERFALIVANPPYLAADDAHLGEGDLRHEPRLALVADEQGLAALKEISAAAPAYLDPQGWLLLEHGFEQGGAVRALLRERGFEAVTSYRDIAGHERVSGGRWPAGDTPAR